MRIDANWNGVIVNTIKAAFIVAAIVGILYMMGFIGHGH